MHTIFPQPNRTVPLFDRFFFNLRGLSIILADLLNSGFSSREQSTGCRLSRLLRWALLVTVAAGTLFAQTVSAATPGFVQGAYLDSGSDATSEPVAYSSNQSSGDYNVVAINCSTGVTITSVVDSEGNSYSLAAGPLANSSEGSTVSIYVAPNIKAGPNTVVVNFSGNTWNEILVAEYAGITGVDVSAIGSGIGNPQSSGSATTTSAKDLLVSYVELAASGSPTAGSGFTKRITPSGNPGLEDRSVSATGSYSGTWTESGATNWISAMVALKTALASPTPTPTPTPTGSLVDSLTLTWNADA